MSWSSDIRCLYCDGKLPLYRKITNGQFCSAPHRKLYWKEQERLCVERLMETQDSLRAYRPVEGVQAIFESKTAAESAPPMASILLPEVAPKFDPSPSMIAADPFSYEADLQPQTPFWAPQIDMDAPAPIAEMIYVDSMPKPCWPMDRLEMAEPGPFEINVTARRPFFAQTYFTKEVSVAGSVAIPMAPRKSRSIRKLEPLATVMLPRKIVSHAAAPQGSPLVAAESAQDAIPRQEKLLALSRFPAHQVSTFAAHTDPIVEVSFTLANRAHLPLGARLREAAPAVGGLRRIPMVQVPLVHGTWIDNLRAVSADETPESPRYELSTPALRPRLRLAAGSRYPISTQESESAVAVIDPENLQPSNPAVAIPERKAMAVAAGGRSAIQIPAPGTAGLLPLDSAKANEPLAAPTHSVTLPQPLLTTPMRPASHLEPLDAKPVSDIMGSAPTLSETKNKLGSPLSIPAAAADAVNPAKVWMNVAGFWKHAPRDLKLLVFGIPILLALALHPTLKKIPYTAPPEVGGMKRSIERNFQGKLDEQWKTVKQNMVQRAAIALDEDFRAGLDEWTSRGGTTEWAFDATGFVRPGPLALYRPSIELTDYQLQFLGMIDKKAMSWVVRAADFDDYYVVKLVVLKPGPVPTIGVTRYAVIHGVAQDRADTMALINAREDMLYRVRMDIHGDVFALTVQGQLVDSWTESRLRTGGVGFFTARGEASRLRWVQVTHQYDMLGRLCAYLAPYNIPSTNGSWQP